MQVHLRGRERRETSSAEHRHSTTHSYQSAEHLKKRDRGSPSLTNLFYDSELVWVHKGSLLSGESMGMRLDYQLTVE